MRVNKESETPHSAGGDYRSIPRKCSMRIGICLVPATLFCLLSASVSQAVESAEPGTDSTSLQYSHSQPSAVPMNEPSLSGDSYRFATIDYPGANATFVRGINNRGDIVGSYRAKGTRRAMLIRGGTLVALPSDSILVTHWSEAFKSNDHGEIVGHFIGDDEVTHGFVVRGRDYALTTLDFPGAAGTHPWAINESGTIVGYWEKPDDGTLHGFTWSKGEFSEVDFPEALDTAVTGINTRGDLVGMWDDGSIFHGFVFSEGQFLSIDPPFPETTGTEPLDIDAFGHIVGVYYDADGVGHGFLMAGETFTQIDYPGAAGTAAYGINSAGQIVGTHADIAGGPNRGFLAQPGRKNKP